MTDQDRIVAIIAAIQDPDNGTNNLIALAKFKFVRDIGFLSTEQLQMIMTVLGLPQ